MDRLPGAPAAACAGARSRHCASRQADAGARAHRAANRPLAPQKGKRSPNTSHGSASSPPSAGPITVPMLKPSVRTAIARACAPCASLPAWIPSSGGSGFNRQVRALPCRRPGALPASALERSLQAPIRQVRGHRFVAASLLRLPAAHPAHYAAARYTPAHGTERPTPARAWLLASQLSPIIDFSATAVPLKMPARTRPASQLMLTTRMRIGRRRQRRRRQTRSCTAVAAMRHSQAKSAAGAAGAGASGDARGCSRAVLH